MLRCLQAEAPIEKQIARWRQEVFQLLLSSRQAQVAHQQQAADQATAINRLEQQLKAADDKAMLLDGRLLDRQVDLDLALVKSKRAEAQLQESYRYLSLESGNSSFLHCIGKSQCSEHCIVQANAYAGIHVTHAF